MSVKTYFPNFDVNHSISFLIIIFTLTVLDQGLVVVLTIQYCSLGEDEALAGKLSLYDEDEVEK